MAKKISIQGYKGSFHQLAVQAYMGKNVSIIPCATFRDVVRIASDASQSDGGFMAIENSIAGSILPNYNLIQQSKLKVGGEIYLQINQHLLVNPGVCIGDIREVHSHPMALLQCIDLLEKHSSWKLVETEDTALSARLIHQHKHKHIAVVASKLASELFDLEVLVSRIQSNKNNYTRFLHLQRKRDWVAVKGANKASVNFHTDHSKGSLAKVLSKIADGDINLSKLQSMPIPAREWKYSFHADMEFQNIEQFETVMEQLKSVTESLNVLGIYRKGKTVR